MLPSILVKQLEKKVVLLVRMVNCHINILVIQ